MLMAILFFREMVTDECLISLKKILQQLMNISQQLLLNINFSANFCLIKNQRCHH